MGADNIHFKERGTKRTKIGKEILFNASSTNDIPALTPTDYDFRLTPINEVMQWVNEVIENKATHIQWSAKHDFDGEVQAICGQAYIQRNETDAEYRERLIKIELQGKKSLEEKERRERMAYERLHKKFGKKQ